MLAANLMPHIYCAVIHCTWRIYSRVLSSPRSADYVASGLSYRANMLSTSTVNSQNTEKKAQNEEGGLCVNTSLFPYHCDCI